MWQALSFMIENAERKILRPPDAKRNKETIYKERVENIMKRMKKLASLLLAVIMVLAMAINVSAAETGSITINDAVKDQTYKVYQILDLESYDADAKAYAYKTTTEWNTFINSDEVKGTYVNVDEQGYVTWVENADVAAFAKEAQAYAKTNSITPSADEITATSATVEFTGLDLGYYLVDTTLGTICSLDTTNPDVVMEEKNEAPSIEKEVEEDSTGVWGETNDADINQVVNYKATITVQKGAENYIMHDTMSEGLTYTGVTDVTINGADVDAANYTVSTSCTDGCTFEVAFDNNYIATLAAGTKIVVTYSATLNEDAVVGLSGNPNEVKLQYGDENQPSYTPVDKTITYTWDAKVIKFTKDGENEKTLAGATFKLSTDDKGANVLRFHALGDNKYEVCADTDCTKDHVTEITTDATGTFNIEGLDSGKYYLTETDAPDGYNKLTAPVTVTITGATTDEETGDLTYSTVETKVENNTGAELPSTGGMGTTIFYVIGGVIVAAVVVVLITRRRMSVE